MNTFHAPGLLPAGEVAAPKCLHCAGPCEEGHSFCFGCLYAEWLAEAKRYTAQMQAEQWDHEHMQRWAERSL